jgi:predicted PurR-regulated permease PerM
MGFLESRRARAGVLIALLGLALLFALAPFLSGLLGAVVLSVVFRPLHEKMSQKVPPTLAAILTTVIALIVILLPAAWLTGVLIAEGPDAAETIQDNALLSRISAFTFMGFDIGAEIAQAGDIVVRWLSTRFLGLVGGAARALLNIVIALLGLYFLLGANESLWPRFRKFVPFSDRNAEALRSRFSSVTQATLLGIVLTAALQGTVVGLGFWAVGLPRAAFWGVITSFASILPLFGSAIVWAPGAVLLALDGRYGAAAVLVAIGAVVASNVDNVIRPMVYRRVSNIHPMITLVGGFAGVSAFGLMGLLLGPLAIAYFFELLDLYEDEYGSGTASEQQTGMEEVVSGEVITDSP